MCLVPQRPKWELFPLPKELVQSTEVLCEIIKRLIINYYYYCYYHYYYYYYYYYYYCHLTQGYRFEHCTCMTVLAEWPAHGQLLLETVSWLSSWHPIASTDRVNQDVVRRLPRINLDFCTAQDMSWIFIIPRLDRGVASKTRWEIDSKLQWSKQISLRSFVRSFVRSSWLRSLNLGRRSRFIISLSTSVDCSSSRS